ncbi:hypothetical protein ACIG3E_32655 [Streptomyces sp. NPDC053474]|uniref:hypothetical protein n=1 Tax=Streptomyces sp. NPDC053474 TaxID=3365704 RepID=UPI0037D5B1A4
MARRSHQPTRSRPHRWCGRLHRGIIALAAPGLALAAVHGATSARLLLALTGAAAIGAIAMLRGAGGGRGRTAPVARRSGWTAAAVAADIATLMAAVRYVLDLASYGFAASAASGSTAAVSALAWIAVHTLTHHRATASAHSGAA